MSTKPSSTTEKNLIKKSSMPKGETADKPQKGTGEGCQICGEEGGVDQCGQCKLGYCRDHLRKQRKIKGSNVRVCDGCEDRNIFEAVTKSDVAAQQDLLVRLEIVKLRHAEMPREVEVREKRYEQALLQKMKVTEKYNTKENLANKRIVKNLETQIQGLKDEATKIDKEIQRMYIREDEMKKGQRVLVREIEEMEEEVRQRMERRRLEGNSSVIKEAAEELEEDQEVVKGEEKEKQKEKEKEVVELEKQDKEDQGRAQEVQPRIEEVITQEDKVQPEVPKAPKQERDSDSSSQSQQIVPDSSSDEEGEQEHVDIDEPLSLPQSSQPQLHLPEEQTERIDTIEPQTQTGQVQEKTLVTQQQAKEMPGESKVEEKKEDVVVKDEDGNVSKGNQRDWMDDLPKMEPSESSESQQQQEPQKPITKSNQDKPLEVLEDNKSQTSSAKGPSATSSNPSLIQSQPQKYPRSPPSKQYKSTFNPAQYQKLQRIDSTHSAFSLPTFTTHHTNYCQAMSTLKSIKIKHKSSQDSLTLLKQRKKKVFIKRSPKMLSLIEEKTKLETLMEQISREFQSFNKEEKSNREKQKKETPAELDDYTSLLNQKRKIQKEINQLQMQRDSLMEAVAKKEGLLENEYIEWESRQRNNIVRGSTIKKKEDCLLF